MTLDEILQMRDKALQDYPEENKLWREYKVAEDEYLEASKLWESSGHYPDFLAMMHKYHIAEEKQDELGEMMGKPNSKGIPPN